MAASSSPAPPGPAKALSDGSDASLLRGLSSGIVDAPVEDIMIFAKWGGGSRVHACGG